MACPFWASPAQCLSAVLPVREEKGRHAVSPPSGLGPPSPCSHSKTLSCSEPCLGELSALPGCCLCCALLNAARKPTEFFVLNCVCPPPPPPPRAAGGGYCEERTVVKRDLHYQLRAVRVPTGPAAGQGREVKAAPECRGVSRRHPRTEPRPPGHCAQPGRAPACGEVWAGLQV